MNVNAQRSIWYATGVSSWILCGVSILTRAAISVDRLLALLLGLRYRHVVTLRRVLVVIICFWLVGAFLGSMIRFRFAIALKASSTLLLVLLFQFTVTQVSSSNYDIKKSKYETMFLKDERMEEEIH